MFENARWIAKKVWKNWKGPSADKMPPSPYVAKSFELQDKPMKAILNICALGQGAYYINGERVDNTFMKPDYTSYKHRLQYQTISVGDKLTS